MQRFIMMTPADMYTDATHGLVMKCPLHRHIRECFLIEMDRAMVKDRLRFQYSLRTLEDHEHDPFFSIPLNMTDDSGARPEFMSDIHDPRFSLICKDFIARRWSIPMAIDDEDMPVLRPPTDQYATIDALENLRLALNERDRLHRQSERTRRRARSAHLLLNSTMAYVRSLRHMYDLTEGEERSVLDSGLLLASDMEIEVLDLATEVMEEYHHDLGRANDALLKVSSRVRAHLDLLHAYDTAQNVNPVIAAAITSHSRLLDASLSWAYYQTTLPLEPFHLTEVVEPTAEEKATWTLASVKSAAVRRFIVADKALNVVREDQASIGDSINLEFDVYPRRDLRTFQVSFYIDRIAYTAATNIPVAGEDDLLLNL
ncbi:hypothetical protein SEPCBS57363_005282 [Sporothrix epigloea]|uniref:Uncharacterized protein n=1 Tax=Sporothrix epigloea TaxID=1892477 RepID=A0ABP0DWP3_9PEZI